MPGKPRNRRLYARLTKRNSLLRNTDCTSVDLRFGNNAACSGSHHRQGRAAPNSVTRLEKRIRPNREIVESFVESFPRNRRMRAAWFAMDSAPSAKAI